MPSTVVLGLQWGDEGKGKIVDALAGHHDMVVRYNGGANSGHTVKVGEKVYKFHLIPSGIVQGKPSIIGNGEVVDPEVLVEEMEQVEDFRENLYISDRAHLVLPQDKEWEAALEEAKGKGRIGTTGRGIGTTYAAKMLRSGARVCDLVDRNGNVDRDSFWKVLQSDPIFDILEKTYGKKVSREEILERYCMLAENFRDRVADTSLMIWEALYRHGGHVLFEGAQAAMLDIDHGTYPFVTSSSPTIGGASAGSGVHVKPERVIGVVKAYTTRVGGGPFPTELLDETGELIRAQGAEYGTTTGRPRRCGWFDVPVAKYAVRVNGATELAVMKLDVLSGLPEIEMCTEYKLDGKPLACFPSRIHDLEECKPEYDHFPGWTGILSAASLMDDLPDNARVYVDELEGYVGVPITIVSVGPERKETIYRKADK